MNPMGDLKWGHRPGTALLPPKLTLNHLENVEASITSQKVVVWMPNPAGTETRNGVHHRTPPLQLLHSRTLSVRLVLVAGAKEFSNLHLQNLVESYRKKLLDEFEDTVFNSEVNNWDEVKANADERGPDGWVTLELKNGSKPVAFSPI